MTRLGLSTSGRLGALAPGALAALLALGCHSGSGRSPDTGIALAWPDVMSSWGAGRGSSIYSLSFFKEPPSGMWVRAVSYATSVDTPCEVFTREQYLQASSERDDWVLLLQVSSNSTTDFQLGPVDSYGGEASAQIVVKHIVHGKEVERHTSLAGTIEVTVAPPTIESQRSGTTFLAQGVVEFSESESLQGGCLGGGWVSVDGGANQESTCVCLAADGGSFNCPGVLGQPSCCIDLDAPRRSFSVSISATPCANACLASDLLLRSYCIDLGAAGGSSLGP